MCAGDSHRAVFPGEAVKAETRKSSKSQGEEGGVGVVCEGQQWRREDTEEGLVMALGRREGSHCVRLSMRIKDLTQETDRKNSVFKKDTDSVLQYIILMS